MDQMSHPLNNNRVTDNEEADVVEETALDEARTSKARGTRPSPLDSCNLKLALPNLLLLPWCHRYDFSGTSLERTYIFSNIFNFILFFGIDHDPPCFL